MQIVTSKRNGNKAKEGSKKRYRLVDVPQVKFANIPVCKYSKIRANLKLPRFRVKILSRCSYYANAVF